MSQRLIARETPISPIDEDLSSTRTSKDPLVEDPDRRWGSQKSVLHKISVPYVAFGILLVK